MIKILLVADEKIIIKAMHKLFEKYGECTSVENGGRAIIPKPASMRMPKYRA